MNVEMTPQELFQWSWRRALDEMKSTASEIGLHAPVLGGPPESWPEEVARVCDTLAEHRTALLRYSEMGRKALEVIQKD